MDLFCKNVREAILRISQSSGHGHVPTCFSIVEILRAVYETIRHDPKRPDWPERDIFILSKGHAALGLYCTLAYYDYFPISDVYSFGKFGSRFGCHADRLKIPGIEVSTGSLGHGIGIAVGMALGLRISGSVRKVYVLVGDGESNEGTVWEAVMVAVNRGLDNLTIIYDDNRSHGRGLQITEPVAQFRGFGCNVVSVDGHDVEALKEAFLQRSSGVKVLVARTLKGYGCETLSCNHYEWHRRSPNDTELAVLMGELNAKTV